MCPKYDEHSHKDCREATSTSKKDENADTSTVLNYSRSPQLSTVSAISERSIPCFVYSRRKFRGKSASLSEDATVSTKRSGEDCLSIICSGSHSHSLSVYERHIVPRNKHESEAVGVAFITGKGSDTGPLNFKSESTNKYSFVKDLGSDDASKSSRSKIVDVDSINDSCSSSKSIIELVSTSVNTELDDSGECSSSGIVTEEVMDEGLTDNDPCVSSLKFEKVHAGVLPSKNGASVSGIDNTNDSSSSRFCKVCSHAGSSMKMLICDNCEEAFHVSCCNPRVKKIPVDEWYCESCLKKKHKLLKETISRRSSNLIGELGRSRNISSIGEPNPILLMLKDSEPYTSDVRVGKGFQAEVPEWSGPFDIGADNSGESLEMDPSEFCILLDLKSNKPSMVGCIGNWLQCKAMVDGTGEVGNGTICGKWRRAPLFEVQTNDWECFGAVLWDPTHADCAVSQELETDQILKQLKYVQMLRPRVAAKRRKMDHMKNGDSFHCSKE